MKPLHTILLITLLVLTTTISAHATPLDDAMKAAERGDYETATQLFRQAAETGDAFAQFTYGLMLLEGVEEMGVRQNQQEGIEWLRKSSDQGSPFAHYHLGEAYERGIGVFQDYAQAAIHYTKAAEVGFPEAQANLGALYADGLGVPQDHHKAFHWSQLAANQGMASAQFNLGLMYAKGRGVEQDHSLAAKWFELAAAQGHPEAQINLGLMYEYGQGVPQQDLVQAYKWFGIASRLGENIPPQHHQEITSQMTPDQIKQAEKLIEAWKPVKTDTDF